MMPNVSGSKSFRVLGSQNVRDASGRSSSKAASKAERSSSRAVARLDNEAASSSFDPFGSSAVRREASGGNQFEPRLDSVHTWQMSIGSQIFLRHSFDGEALLELIPAPPAPQRIDMIERRNRVGDGADDEAGGAVVDHLGN